MVEAASSCSDEADRSLIARPRQNIGKVTTIISHHNWHLKGGTNVKRLIFIVVFTVGFTSLLIGCNSNSQNSTSEMEQLKQQVNKLTTENQVLKDQLAKATSSTEEDNAHVSSTEPSPSATLTPEPDKHIELNKPLAIPDFAEITLTKAKFTSKVVPPKPDSFYTYYEVKDPSNIYLDIVLKVKSLLATEKGSDEFARVTVKYDDKYEYDSFSTIEESGGGNFTFTNITSIEPLKSGTLHYIAELPKESSEDNKSIQIYVSIQDTEYTYTLR